VELLKGRESNPSLSGNREGISSGTVYNVGDIGTAGGRYLWARSVGVRGKVCDPDAALLVRL